MVLSTIVTIAALQASGISLNLFHLISLILAAGLGLDYALFFEHAADDAAEQRRTLHAISGLRAVDVLGFHAACDVEAARVAGDRDAGRDRRRGQLLAEPVADETGPHAGGVKPLKGPARSAACCGWRRSSTHRPRGAAPST